MSSPIETLAPAFPSGRVLFSDADLIVVDKPFGLSMSSPESDGNDLVARLRRYFSSFSGGCPYFALHEHLDRDVSGAVALSSNPAANSAMVNAIRERRFRTTWVALTQGRMKAQSGSSRVFIRRVRSGFVAERNKLAGSTACTMRWRVRNEMGDRQLIELQISEGGARALRAAVPVVLPIRIIGDVRQGGGTAPRLMLHAHQLEMPHPLSGEALRTVAPIPAVMTWWQRATSHTLPSSEELESLLRDSGLAREPLVRRGIDAFRVFHGEGEGINGLDLDCYGSHLVVWIGEQFSAADRARAIEVADRLGFAGIYLKVRPQHASRIVDSRRADIAPSVPVCGEAASEPMVVNEEGRRFTVRLGDGLQTGVFLDQRDNRAWLAGQVRGRSVLNLFAYTCAFTVAAALAGAPSSLSVDISARALEVGRANLEANGISGDSHGLVCADVLDWLKRAKRGKARFGIIVLDPPSFSTTRSNRFSVVSDMKSVATDCVGLVDDAGGVLLVCTNHRAFSMKRFRRILQEAVREAGRRMEGMQELEPSLDFPVAVGEEPHMKAIAVQIGERTMTGDV